VSATLALPLRAPGGASARLASALALLSIRLPAAPPLAADEEARLVRAARLGSRPAAERLYEAHVARVYRAVRAVAGSDAEAEDAVQDAFVDALTNLARYEPRPGLRLVAWLVTLALNRARKARARAARAEPRDPARLAEAREAAAAAQPDAPGWEADRLLRRRAVLDALAALPARDREVVALFHGAELTAEETARAVGTSAANVRKICERRRRELLERLGEEGEA
jgi:RNA polymerase sigma-70 factor (ECF subfamily)